MRRYVMLIFCWASMISLAQQNITVETIVFPNTAEPSAKSNIPHITGNPGTDDSVVVKINNTIRETFMIDDFDPVKAVDFNWSGADYTYEIKSNILWISYHGEYLGPYPSEVKDNLFFDLSNGNLLDNRTLPFSALFSLEGYFSFLNKYWIPGCSKEFEKAAKCAGSEPDCSCYDIAFSLSDNHLKIFFTGECFPHAAQDCNPAYSANLPADSVKPFLSSFGRYVLFNTEYVRMTELDRFLFYRDNLKTIPDYYFISGSIGNKYPVSMAIEINDSSKKVTGYYFYNKQQKSISLTGEFNPAKINLTESSDNKITGEFEFIIQQSYNENGFNAGNEIYWTGKWKGAGTSKPMMISLTDIKRNK
jgi:hypothetical protein